MFHETPDLTMGQFETSKTTIKYSFKVSNELRQVTLTSAQKLKKD